MRIHVRPCFLALLLLSPFLAQANKLGINFQGNQHGFYVGYPVTATAFGIPVAHWTNMPDATSGSETIPLPGGGSLDVTWTCANTWTIQTDAPAAGDREVVYGYLDDPSGYYITLSGFSNVVDYTIQLIAASDDADSFFDAFLNWGGGTEYLSYSATNDGFAAPLSGLSTVSSTLTTNSIILSGITGAFPIRSTLAGILINYTAKSGDIVITNAVHRPDGILIDWFSPADQHIVAVCTNLMKDQFALIGDVLATYETTVPNDPARGFARVRAVNVMDFPDAALRDAVFDSIPFKYEPPDEIYDIDVENMTDLKGSDYGITNIAGLENLYNLTVLELPGNGLTSLNLSPFAHLTELYCNSNQLTHLDLSGCTNLNYVQCDNNQLTNLSSFVLNAQQGGLGTGSSVYVSGNPLSLYALTNQIPALQAYGVYVSGP